MAGSATSAPWVHPVLWGVVGIFVLWACFMQIIQWMEQITREGEPLIDYLRDVRPRPSLPHLVDISVEMQERPVDLSQQQYDDILAAGQLTPEKQHHGPPGGALYKVPDLYDMAASGRTILIFLSYHMVFFVMGVAGWLCFYYLKPPANVWRLNNRIRSIFARPAIPSRAWASWFSNISIGEVIIYSLLIILPKITMTITRFEERKEKWDSGEVHSVNALEHGEFNEHQFWLREVGFWLGIDFLIQMPLLFAFASRGSLLNTYLGVKYGTMLKWHRWLGAITLIEIITHGILYQILWLSGSFKMWAREMARLDMGHVSNLPGAVAWGGAILMALFLWPYTRRKAYKLFYYSHIIGAAVFMIFGAMHHNRTWTYAAAGMVIYGIDVAFRLYQTSMSVTVDVSNNRDNNIISIRIPVKKNVEYKDGGHVWISIPRLDMYDYHPLSITSSPVAPEWGNTMLLQCKVYDKWTQRLADAANNGFFDGPVDAKIQGPYDGHNMAGYEVDTFTRKLFISGGVGIAAVLPMLKRMAVHMENTASEADKADATKKITIVHSARTPAEIMLAAPLLKHSSVLDLRLHFTGDAKAITPSDYTLPAPLSYDSTNSGSNGKLSAGKDVESKAAGSSYFPMRAIPGKWEALFVWTMSWFFSFWVLIMAEMWYDSSLKSQANALSSDDKNARRIQNMGWLVFAMTLTVPFVPFFLLVAWRVGRYYLFFRVSSGTSSSGSDSGVASVGAREDSITMPGVPGGAVAAETASLDVGASGPSLSLSSLSTASVTLNTGRPDLTAVVKEVAANRGSGDCMGVWSAGPKAMNNLVYEASGRLGGDVRLFPLAYEM